MVEPEKFKEQVVGWAGKIGVEPKEIHIREMSRKWASCSTSGRLTSPYNSIFIVEKIILN